MVVTVVDIKMSGGSSSALPIQLTCHMAQIPTLTPGLDAVLWKQAMAQFIHSSSNNTLTGTKYVLAA